MNLNGRQIEYVNQIKELAHCVAVPQQLGMITQNPTGLSSAVIAHELLKRVSTAYLVEALNQLQADLQLEQNQIHPDQTLIKTHTHYQHPFTINEREFLIFSGP